jgi:miniconductance mechanosensitive channel
LLADALGVLCLLAAMWLVNRVAKSIIVSVVRRIVPRSPYLEQKRGELAAERCEREDEAAPAGCGPLSNIGCFRACVTAYLKAHPMLRQDTHFFVRQREPTDKGLPLELYVFSRDTRWAAYESVQSDIARCLARLVKRAAAWNVA